MNNKGGVGKTHTVFHLAGAFAEAGRRVLLIDLDPQGNLSSLLCPSPNPSKTLHAVLVDDVPLAAVAQETDFENIRIVPSNPKLQSLDALLQNEPDAQIRLSDAIQELVRSDSGYDLVLLDCPPSLALTTRNALAAAQHVIIPLEADKFSIDGLDTLLRVVESMKRVVNPDLEIAGILISLFKGRRSIEMLYEEALRSRSLPVFTTVIKDSAKYREAITARQPITHYKPTSEFADAFRELIKELEKAYVR
jgi:chromosome partitioning protein